MIVLASTQALPSAENYVFRLHLRGMAKRRAVSRSFVVVLRRVRSATYVAFFVSFPYHKTSARLRRHGEAMTAKSALFPTATTTTHTKMNPSCCILKQQGGKWAHGKTHMLGRCLCRYVLDAVIESYVKPRLLSGWEATVPNALLLSEL